MHQRAFQPIWQRDNSEHRLTYQDREPTLESARAGLWRRNNDENLSIRHTNGRKVTCACKTCKCIQVFTNPNECCEYEDSLMWYSWVQVFIERIKYHQVTVQKNWPNGWINSSVYSRNKWNILQYLQQRVGYQLWAMLLCAYFYFLWMKTCKMSYIGNQCRHGAEMQHHGQRPEGLLVAFEFSFLYFYCTLWLIKWNVM